MGILLGILLHAIGGLAAGSFYIPIAKIKNWKWESGWIVNGVVAWVLTPLLVAWLTVPDPQSLWSSLGVSSLFWPFFFGVLWGIGALTFGLTMRYLGISLGMAMALGFSAVFGTLIPPFYEGNLEVFFHKPTLPIGLVICFFGIFIIGLAGSKKEKELVPEQKQETLKEFNFGFGIIVAAISGILSACFAFGLAAGGEVSQAAVEQGTKSLWQTSPVLVLVMGGGFLTNLIWCLALNFKNRSFGDYYQTIPLKRNYILAGLAGLVWYHQFMFYGMGSTFLGKDMEFIGWTLHMAFIILFSNLWGVYFKEWKGVCFKTKMKLYSGLVLIIFSMVLIGLAAW